MANKTKLANLIPEGREILFACIGTDRSTGDSLGPLVGMGLSKKGYTVIGTISEPLHALNLDYALNDIQENYPNHFIVAIDACLGTSLRIGKISVKDEPIKPGVGVGKTLPQVGDIGIKGVVNVSGFMEHSVLQSTRLSVVWDMAEEIIEMCDSVMKNNSKLGGIKLKTKLPTGVFPSGNRYKATIKFKCQQHHLGSYDTVKEAEYVYKKVRLMADRIIEGVEFPEVVEVRVNVPYEVIRYVERPTFFSRLFNRTK